MNTLAAAKKWKQNVGQRNLERQQQTARKEFFCPPGQRQFTRRNSLFSSPDFSSPATPGGAEEDPWPKDVERSYGSTDDADAQALLTTSPERRGSGSSSSNTNRHVSTFTSTKDAQEIRGQFDYPSAQSVVAKQVCVSLGYCVYMLTAWLYVSIQQQSLFPVCSAYWGPGHWGGWLCVWSVLTCWTFPLFCCIVLLMYYYRDLLHTRLYYEMFAHRVHIDFMNISFWEAPMIRMAIVWFVLCFLMYPLTGQVHVRSILVWLPFWTPILSFAAMIYLDWDLESRLLSVAKFVETDCEWALSHMADCSFIRDYVAEVAFHRVHGKMKKRDKAPELSTGMFILEICAESEVMERRGDEIDPSQASRSIVSALWGRYWVKEFLYSPYLVDEEALNFHFWYSVYTIFTIVLVMMLVALWGVTIVAHLHEQDIIASSLLTEWIHLDYFSVARAVPVAPSPTGAAPPGESERTREHAVSWTQSLSNLGILAAASTQLIIFGVASFLVYRWNSQMRAKNEEPQCGIRTCLCALCCTWLSCCYPIDKM